MSIRLSDMKVSLDEVQKKVKEMYGPKKAEPEDCSRCNGKGGWWIPLYGDANLGYSHFDKCPTCNGTGKHVIRHSKYEGRLPQTNRLPI